MDESYDVAVVGAGMGGLSAAIALAARDLDVVVFEAGSEIGGKVGRSVVDGVEFDTGPSVLTMPDVLADLFAHAGTSLPAELDLVERQEVFEYRWPDGTRLPVHFHVEETLQNVADVLGIAAREQLHDFLRYARRIWEEAAPAFVFGDAPTIGTAIGLGLRSLGAVRAIDPMRTMAGAIDHHVREPHLRDLLYRYATYNGSDPWRAPATLNCIAHVELTLGCYGVRGGMYELPRALERVARGLGVRFVFDEPVEKIETDAGAVSAVTTTNRRVSVRQVVANADVRHVFDDLLDTPDPSSTQEPSMSGWTAVIRANRRDRTSHGVVFPERYRPEFTDIFEQGRCPQSPTVYVCAQETAHRRTGWTEHEPLFVMANAPPVSRTVDPNYAGLRARVIQRLRRIEWIVDGDDIVWERTPAELAARFPGSDGSIYGAASNSKFAAFQRPANRVAEVKGLYLASGSAHPGGGVPLCLLSGRAAARAVLDDR